MFIQGQIVEGIWPSDGVWYKAKVTDTHKSTFERVKCIPTDIFLINCTNFEGAVNVQYLDDGIKRRLLPHQVTLFFHLLGL